MLRAHFGRHGLRSGVNPGVLWMSQTELAEVQQTDTEFTESLEESLRIARARREQSASEHRALRREYEQKLKAYDAVLADYYGEKEKVEQARLDAQTDGEKLLRLAQVGSFCACC